MTHLCVTGVLLKVRFKNLRVEDFLTDFHLSRVANGQLGDALEHPLQL